MAYYVGGTTILTSDGTQGGQCAVANPGFLVVEARVLLSASGLPTNEYTVEAINGSTVTLRAVASGSGQQGTDISQYTMVLGAVLTMVPQFVNPKNGPNTGSTYTMSGVAGVAIGGGTSSQSTGTVQFINGNGFSFGLSNGAMTASVQPGAAAGIGAVGAGTQVQTSGTLSFLNSNNVTFGMNNSSQITASANVPAQTAYQFSNANGVSFGTNGSTVTATVVTNYQSQGAYLTTAMASNAGSGFMSTSERANYQTVGAYLTTAMASNAGTGFMSTSERNNYFATAANTFANSTHTHGTGPSITGSISVTSNSGAWSISIPNFLTTAAQSDHSHGNPTLALTNLSGTTASNSAGLTLSLSAAAPGGGGGAAISAAGGSQSTGTVVFSNSNGVSFGYNAGVITATVQPGAAAGLAAGAAGTQSATSGTLNFVNSNGMTFGMSGSSQITASYTVPGATSFSNLNNVSFGLAGSTITASASFPAQTQQPVWYSASGTLTSANTLVFSNANGVSFSTVAGGVVATVKTDYQTAGAYLTTAMASNAGTNYMSTSERANYFATAANTFANSTHSHGNPTLALTNLTGTTASNSAGFTLSLSAANGGGGADGYNAAQFTNSTANTTMGLVWAGNSAGSGNITMGLTGSTITMSAPSGGAGGPQISAAGGGQSTGTVIFSNANGVSFGYNAGTITATVATNYQSQGAYLTTAALSQDSSKYAGTITGITGGIGLTANTSGVSVSIPAYLTTAMVSNAGTGFMSTSERANYFATAANTFANQTHTHGTGPTFQLTNVSASVTSNSTAWTLALSAGAGGGGGIAAAVPGTTQTSGTVVFSNSNGMSFGLNAGTMTGSYDVSQLTVGNNLSLSSVGSTVTLNALAVAAQAGTVTQTSGTLVFTNSNNVSFGITNGSQLTASASFNQTQQPVWYSASGTLTSANTLVFSNANGVSFSTVAGGVVATVQTNYQSSNANYLTSQSVQAASGSNGSFTFQTLSFSNGNGISFGTSAGSAITASYTVPTQTVQPVAVSGSNGSFAFSTLTMGNSNGLSFYTTNGSIVASYTVPAGGGAAISAAGGSQNTGTVIFSNANGVSFGYNAGTITATVNPGAAAGIAAIAAGTQTATSGTQVFSNSNNVSFTMNGSSQIVASASYPAQTVQPVAASGSNGSFAFSTLSHGNSNGFSFYTTNGSIVGSYTVPTVPGATVFSNSNNVSFGLAGSTVTATATFNQTQQPIWYSASGTLTSANTLVFSNANGVSFSTVAGGVVATVKTDYQTAGAYLTTAALSQDSSKYAGTGTSATNATFTLNTNGLAFNGGAYLTTAMQSQMTSNYMSTAERGNYFYTSNNTFANSTHSHGNPTLNLTNLSGTTASNSAGFTLSLSAAAPGGGGGIAAAAGTQTQTSGTLAFANSNGITFGMSNSSQITASYDVSGFTAGNNISFSQAGSTVTINAQAVAFALTNTTQTSGTIVFGTGGNVTFGYNAGTITASAAGGGGGGAALQGSGTYTQNTGTVQFANSNSVTFGLTAGSMTASFDASYFTAGNNISLSTAGSTMSINAQAVALAVAGGTQTSGTVLFSNSNGISFGLNAGTMTANMAGPMGVIVNASASTLTNGTLGFSNSNGIGWGWNGSTITASYSHSGPTGVVVNASASTLTNGNLVFSNSNGLAWGWNGSTITGDLSASAYAVGANTINAGSTSGAMPVDSLMFSGAGNISVGMNGSTVIISATGGGGGGAAIAGSGTYTQNTGTITFQNSNNVTFGLSNNGVMTASFNANNTASTFQAGISNIGNTAGTSGLVQNNMVFVGGGGVTLSQSVNGQSGTMSIKAGPDYVLTYQNRQLGASTTLGSSQQQNQLWLVPFRVINPVSGSTLQIMQSFTGSASSATTGTYAQTYNMAIYSQHSTDANRFDTWWSQQRTLSVMASNTSSGGWAFNGAGSSGGSTVVVTQFYGMRIIEFSIGSTVPPGLYLFGMNISSSTAQYSAVVGTAHGIVVDAPMPLAMGQNFGAATATSIGYVDAGTWSSQTTAGIPATVSIGHIKPMSNYVPYFKIGAL